MADVKVRWSLEYPVEGSDDVYRLAVGSLSFPQDSNPDDVAKAVRKAALDDAEIWFGIEDGNGFEWGRHGNVFKVTPCHEEPTGGREKALRVRK
jgi:hypothetical protein